MGLARVIRPRVIRRIPIATNGPRKPLYLTFDDGPVPEQTLAIADLLNKYSARATFFVIAKHAQSQPKVINALVDAGHSIGNHSLDHNTLTFFRTAKRLQKWIQEADSILSDLTGGTPVGFRSPVGIQTPHLHYVLGKLKMPLVHWDVRFFDTVIPFTVERARASFRFTKPGSIVLLHERQFIQSPGEFLESLEEYLKVAAANGYTLLPITRESII